MRTRQILPFSMRAGFETSEAHGGNTREGKAAMSASPTRPGNCRIGCIGLMRMRRSPGSRTWLRKKSIRMRLRITRRCIGANCAGCHGTDGKGGAALALGDPVYLAIADDAVHEARSDRGGIPGRRCRHLRRAKAECSRRSRLKSSSREFVNSRRSRTYCVAWILRRILDDSRQRFTGADVYATYCSSCHGPAGRGEAEGRVRS